MACTDIKCNDQVEEDRFVFEGTTFKVNKEAAFSTRGRPLYLGYITKGFVKGGNQMNINICGSEAISQNAANPL